MDILLGTSNPGKLKELSALLSNLQLTLLSPLDLELSGSVTESGATYMENARLKASAYCKESGMWCLADDSGLEVDALGGFPGVSSARMAGKGKTDADRRQRLLQMLATHPQPWRARFRAVVALAGPGGSIDLAEGTCEGIIIPNERGTGGFGYDPIFQVGGTGATMAELTLEQKNQRSHRARAVRALLPILRTRLGLSE
jgi:XTP/dITP diphosphohydrolase